MREYQREWDFDGLVLEAAALIKENNEEMDFFGKKVDLNTLYYKRIDQAGMLRMYSVREDGKLIGYSLFIINKHLHYKNDWQANQDILFITKKHRGNGVSFIKYCDQALKDDGISFVFRSVTKFKDWSLVLKILDYEEVETIYMKNLTEG